MLWTLLSLGNPTSRFLQRVITISNGRCFSAAPLPVDATRRRRRRVAGQPWPCRGYVSSPHPYDPNPAPEYRDLAICLLLFRFLAPFVEWVRENQRGISYRFWLLNPARGELATGSSGEPVDLGVGGIFTPVILVKFSESIGIR